MRFKERHDSIVKKVQPRLDSLLWIDIIIFSLFVLLAVVLYLFWAEGYFGINTFNKSLANTSVILMSMSFALSGLTYFWDFVDTKIVYRKHLGVIGFAYGFVHGGISLGFYLYDYFINDVLLVGSDFNFGTVWTYWGLPVSNWVAFISALIAIVYFALMASISNKYGPMVLGGLRWRKVLRYGYFAMFLIFLHESIKNFSEWESWYSSIFLGGTLLPPLSLISGVMLISIFALRGSLEVSLRKAHARKETASKTTKSNS